MFEPDDDDLQIVHNGISGDGVVGYRFKLLPDLSLSPFLGASIDRWRGILRGRDGASCFSPKSREGLNWSGNSFACVWGGFIPFWEDVDQGERPEGDLGYFVNPGFSWKMAEVGLFYIYTRFKSATCRLVR
jgi:hypothetical protein